jgi:hypothetical protein
VRSVSDKICKEIQNTHSNFFRTRAIDETMWKNIQVFNLKLDRQLSRKYFTSDAIYNGSTGMTLYYYICRSWQDCCRREESQPWLSVSVESVESECWCLKNVIFYAFIMRLTVEERVFILDSYLKTMSYAHCRQSFFEKFRRQAPAKKCYCEND